MVRGAPHFQHFVGGCGKMGLLTMSSTVGRFFHQSNQDFSNPNAKLDFMEVIIQSTPTRRRTPSRLTTGDRRNRMVGRPPVARWNASMTRS